MQAQDPFEPSKILPPEAAPLEAFPPEETPAEPPKKSLLRGLLSFLWEVVQTLALAGVLYLGINALTARVRVEGFSMYPTFKSGEFVLVYRLAYRTSPPHRGDIVVFQPQAFPSLASKNHQDDYIKRVIGLPGEEVAVRDGHVYIDGHLIVEPYIAEPPHYSGVWKVPPGEVFVLGDNRNNSTDSHFFGPVSLEQMVGRAVLVYWPPRAWRVLHDPQYPASP